jgi:hypothetical protein
MKGPDLELNIQIVVHGSLLGRFKVSNTIAKEHVMTTAKRLLTTTAAILLVASLVCAQEQNAANTNRSAITVTAVATTDRVRFTAPSTVVQMRLEVYGANGGKVFDNEVRGGNVIDWHLLNGQGDRLLDGTYISVITSKSLSGRLSQKLGTIIIENAAVSVQPVDTAQLTAKQSQAVGPVEESASLTVVKEGETQTATVIAHNGTEGQLIRGQGALSFRLGDFFSGTDREQMRLTAEGNLGIGTSDPRVKLDVAGMIGAREGLMFSDGSTLSVNNKGVLKHTSAQGTLSATVAGTGTQNRLAKWTDNVGTLGDSGLTEIGGFLGIGTANPDSLVNIQGTVPSLLGHMTVIRTTGAFNGFGLLMDATGSGNNNLGLSVNGVRKGGFSWDNARDFLGFVNYSYSPNDFSLRINSNGSLTYHDGVSSAEYFRITAGGNVGIGTINPQAKLDVGGDIIVAGNAVVAGNIAAKYQDVAEWVPARREIAPATVVCLDVTRTNTVTPSARAYDSRIAGIVSAQPGLILGERGLGKVMVATTGRVKVKVDATRHPIKIGDLLVTSDKPGMAMKSQPIRIAGKLIHRPGTIIGKALEPLARGQAEILVLLSLH